MLGVPSPLARPFFERKFPIPFRDFEGRCMNASAANSLYFVLGAGPGEDYWSEGYENDCETLEKLGYRPS